MSTTSTTTASTSTPSFHFKSSTTSAHDTALSSSLPDSPPLSAPNSPFFDSKPLRQPRERYAAPSTNYLAEFPHRRSIPALGVEFEKGIQLRELLNLPEGDRKEALFEELSYSISLHGVAFFPSQDLTGDELGQLALALGRATNTDGELHVHPTQQLGEDGKPKPGAISNAPDAKGRQISFKDDRSELVSQGLHSDISFEKRPARYSMLKMHTLPPLGGNTTFNSAYAHYDMLSEPMKIFLSGLKATHSGAMFRHQAREHGFDLHLGPRGAPENVGDDFLAEHPIIRTSDVTGFHQLFVNQTFTERIVGLGFDESKAILDYLFKLQAQAHDAMLSYRWNVNDLAIWDNAAVNHCATWDYREARAGERTVCVGEIPYYDGENGRSRKQTTGSPI